MNNFIERNVNLKNEHIDGEVVTKIPEEFAVKNCLIIFKETVNVIYIAVESVPDILIKEEISFLCGKRVKFFKTDKEQILDAINVYYCRGNVKEAAYNLKKWSKETKVEDSAEKEEKSPAVKIINSIINEAICRRTSDIHIEPFLNNICVRFRIDGLMYKFINIPKELYSFICTRLKILASMDISEKRLPQDGKIKYIYKEKDYDLRVSTSPTINGEKIVLRILYKSDQMKKLDHLGYSIRDINIIKKMITKSHGLILVTGPTGSGKSTTLYSILNYLNREERNIVSIEDPVEYTIEGVNQVNVNYKLGLSFVEGLKNTLRQDPDIIMIGEIRDEETAHIAIRAAITGHLVISTLHTNNAKETILRLEDMGIPKYLIESCLIGIISQKLVKKICNNCRKEYVVSDEAREKLGLKSDQKIYCGTGCGKCNNSGYFGRTVAYEILCNLQNYNMSENIKDNCKILVEKGISSYDEFLRIII